MLCSPSPLTAPLPATAPACRSQRAPPEAGSRPNARLLGVAALLTLPVALAQAAAAWVSLLVRSGGLAPEAAPRSVLGIFFATYWEGTEQQCGASAPG